MVPSVNKGSKWSTYVVFAAFGGAASWFGTSLCFMQIPTYQKYFGLELSNRLEIGYNLGTIPCGLFLLLRPQWRSCWYLVVIQGLSVFMLCLAVPGSPFFSEKSLAVATFLSGAVGYSAQFTAVPWLMRFENELVGAFWAGDSFTAVLAALMVLLQRPKEPRFGLLAYMIVCGLPVVVTSAIALYIIETTNIGRLPPEDEKPSLEEEDLLIIDADAVVVVKPKPYLRQSQTWRLGAVCFWSQFADWGLGDSLYPYACANATRRVGRCELWTNELSLLTQLLGLALASKIRFKPTHLLFILWLPVLVYTFLFFLLLAMAYSTSIFDDRSVVAVMALLRFLGPYTRNVVPRLIQPLYPKTDHENVPLFFGLLSILGNIIGGATATALIRLTYPY